MGTVKLSNVISSREEIRRMGPNIHVIEAVMAENF